MMLMMARTRLICHHHPDGHGPPLTMPLTSAACNHQTFLARRLEIYMLAAFCYLKVLPLRYILYYFFLKDTVLVSSIMLRDLGFAVPATVGPTGAPPLARHSGECARPIVKPYC